MQGHHRGKKVLRNSSEVALRSIAVFLMSVFFLLFFAVPIGIAFIGSFHQWNPLKQQFDFLGMRNWNRIFANGLFWHSMKNTFVFAMIAVFFRVILGLILAHVLHSKLIKHKSVYRTLYYLPTITPMVAVAFVWKFIFDPRIGLLNRLLNSDINWLYDGRYALAAMLILTIWKDFGYAVVILLGGLYSLPTECFEAAEIDGANSWQRYQADPTTSKTNGTVCYHCLTYLVFPSIYSGDGFNSGRAWHTDISRHLFDL